MNSRIKKNLGQAATGAIIVASLLTGATSWLLNIVLSSPVNAETKIAEINTTLTKLCTDYGLTVARIDDNMQAIGKALKVNVTSGRANNDPCK